jgi:hypothetical protein
MPRTPDGRRIWNPPSARMELLNEHFTRLSKGERIAVPKI